MMFSVFVVVLTVLTMNVAAKAAKDMAVLEVVLWDEPTDNGDYSTQTYTLEASFSIAGSKTSAEGNIVQMHPLGLCNNSENDELVEYGWVGVVKLETPMSESQPCLSVFGKAKRALKRGATAVIFDVTDHPNAVDQLQKGAGSPLDRPVLLIHGEAAYTLMNIVSKQRIARARIHYTPALLPRKNSSNEYFNMGIFMAFFVLVSLVCILLLLKIKWRQRRKQTSLTRLAIFAVSKMEVRKYQRPEGAGRRTSSQNSSWSMSSDGCICAICLEEFKDGEELRVVSCSHEFHRHCVDPWLIKNRTCPLCLHNIIEYPSSASVLQSNPPYPQSNSRRRRRFFNLRLPRRQQSSSSSLRSQNALPQANLVCPTRPNNQASIRAFMHPYAERNCTPEIPITRNNEQRREMMRGPTYCGCRNLPNRQWSYCPHVVSNHRHYHSNTYYEHHIDYIGQQPTMVDEYQHRLVPVVVQLRTHEMSSSGYDGSVSNNMDASSSSSDSLALTAPCKSEPEQELSDHTNGSENIDSNQSVYGSSSTFRSDPQSTDPNVYSRRRSDPLENTSTNSADNSPPTRLTPSCMIRKKAAHDGKGHGRHSIRNKNSHSMENVAGCDSGHKAATANNNLRHTFTSKGQCTACSQLLRLPAKLPLKEQHRRDSHSRGRKGGRSSHHHHHHHSPVRNTRNSLSSQHFDRQIEHRKCVPSSRTNPIQSVVLYTNQSGVLTVPSPPDQVKHLEEMV